MSRPYIPANLRRYVIERAHGRCEYCLIHQDDLPTSHQIDHIIPLKHNGDTEASNLALACLECNRYKGSDIASRDTKSGELLPLFNPRTQIWSEHFVTDGAYVSGLTLIGRGTIILLRINEAKRILQRQILTDIDRYPSKDLR